MEASEIKKKVNKLTEIIKKSEEELKLIREETCSHSKFEVGNTNKTSGQFVLGKICSICGEYLGYPTNDEKEKAGY